MNPPHETRVLPNPSDSALMNLARAAFANVMEGAEPSWPILDLSDPRQRVFGDYELLQEIGRGGMGVVYRARQNSLEREVAIKFIAVDFADGSHVARFLSEARAAAKLNHPGIVPVHEVGSIDGVHYFSMPWIKGRTLADLIDSGSLSHDAVVSLMLKLCEAIDYAHRLGLLHLDLKPANVLIDERGEPLIADFGLARHMDEQGGVDAQEVSGTPSFMAPEQILIKQYRMTPATDIYALGAILYRCLTGVSPHGSGRSDEQVQRAIAGRVRSVRELVPKLSADLGAITMKCLELAQKERYPTVAALADDLRRVRDDLPVSVRRAGPVERLRLWVKREPRFAMAASVAAAALLIGTVATASQWNEATQQRDVAVSQRDFANAARKEAEAQRDLAQGMAELGAFLFLQGMAHERSGTEAGGVKTDVGKGMEEKENDVAVQIMEWLQRRYPDDEKHQADVFIAFFNATEKNTAIVSWAYSSFTLLDPLVRVMGSEYRRQVIDDLLTGNDPDRYAQAARLIRFDEAGEPQAPHFRAALDQAMAMQPDNPAVWEMAVRFCAGEDVCYWPDAAQRFVEVDPDNAYSWIWLFLQSEGMEARAALHEAASRKVFDEYFGRAMIDAVTPFATSRVPVPELLTAVARIIAPNDPPQIVPVIVEAGRIPLPPWQKLRQYCKREQNLPGATDVYDDCKAVGLLMARANNSSALAKMIGAGIVWYSTADPLLRQEVFEIRRRTYYIMEHIRDRMDLIPKYSSVLDFYEVAAREGELGAWAYDLRLEGIAPEPPGDWQPKDPCLLLMGDEYSACDKTRADVE